MAQAPQGQHDMVGRPDDEIINEAIALKNGYRLVFSDEFNYKGAPDPKKWSYDISRNKLGWYNNEKQYYTANKRKNARVANGRLIIEAHKEDLSRMSDWGGQAFSSAKLTTAQSKIFRYGYLEVRAKLPCQLGSWPAIWGLGVNPTKEWPDLGEIDVMEHTGVRAKMIQQTVHTGAYNHLTGSQKTQMTQLDTACDQFHVYHLLWTKDAIKQGIDGHFKMIFKNDGTNNQATWPFDDPSFLILNMAVGGEYAGDQVDIRSLPWRFEIDYVRLYELKN